MNQSTPRCRMCSWHDDIIGYHSEETDDWYIDEGDLKDLTMNKITVDQTVQGTIEILQLQHSDNGSISLLGKSCESHRYRS